LVGLPVKTPVETLGESLGGKYRRKSRQLVTRSDQGGEDLGNGENRERSGVKILSRAVGNFWDFNSRLCARRWGTGPLGGGFLEILEALGGAGPSWGPVQGGRARAEPR